MSPGARAPEAGSLPVLRPREWPWPPGNRLRVRPWANGFKREAAQPNGPSSAGSRRCTEASRWQRRVREPAVSGGSGLLAGLTQPLPPPRRAVVPSPGFDPASLLSPPMQSRGEEAQLGLFVTRACELPGEWFCVLVGRRRSGNVGTVEARSWLQGPATTPALRRERPGSAEFAGLWPCRFRKEREAVGPGGPSPPASCVLPACLVSMCRGSSACTSNRVRTLGFPKHCHTRCQCLRLVAA